MKNTVKLKYLGTSYSSSIAAKELIDTGFPVYGAAGLMGYNDVPQENKEYLGIVKDGAGVGRVNIYPANSSLLGTMAYIIPNVGVNITWLKYVLDSMHLGNDAEKTTIPHIYFSEYGNNSIPNNSFVNQNNIALYLDRKCAAIDEAIERHKKIIEKLVEYKYHKNAECTANLHSVKMGRFLASVQTGPFGSQLHADEYIENGIAVINPANISNGDIVIDPKCTVSSEKALELSRHLLNKGDIVIGRRGEMGRCAVVKEDGLICGTGCFVIKCDKGLLPDYASLCIRSKQVVEYLTQSAIGTTMLNLNTDIIMNCPIPYCDLETQMDIVTEVDYISARCAIATEKHQSIIKKLEEYRKSIIYYTVTGKIDCREASS